MRDEKERETERPHTEVREREREKERERERNRERERERQRETESNRSGSSFSCESFADRFANGEGSPIRANRIRKCVHAINIGFFFANLFARIDSRE